MFRRARITLTGWYLVIIMLISMSFSAAMYRVISLELTRIEHIQRLRTERRLPLPFDRSEPSRFFLDPELVAETKNRLALTLIIINAAILASSALAGYFLAGRTLTPIVLMLDEQRRFISDASHELRTPLTALKSEIEVNLRDKQLTLSETKKLLRSNLEEVNHLQILSDRLIKLGQYQKGNNGLSMTTISLQSAIQDAVQKTEWEAKEKDIAITYAGGDFAIMGNLRAIAELFVIFLDNAIKYSPKQTKVRITAQKTDGRIRVRISDQGEGIPKEDLPHVFDRFYRSDKSRTKTTIPGYGLGLSIAKQIVDQHHGSITVQSKPNNGSTFTVELPAV